MSMVTVTAGLAPLQFGDVFPAALDPYSQVLSELVVFLVATVVAYSDDVEAALLELQQIAVNEEDVMDDPAPQARFLELGPDNITVQAEFRVDDPAKSDVAEIRAGFRREVKHRFDEAGLTLGPPAGRELSGNVAVTQD
jgi:small-conductance mechanosensitive channel